jgi:hypothetical protein
MVQDFPDLVFPFWILTKVVENLGSPTREQQRIVWLVWGQTRNMKLGVDTPIEKLRGELERVVR